MKKLILTAATLIMLSGCTKPISEYTANDVDSGFDDYSHTLVIEGPSVHVGFGTEFSGNPKYLAPDFYSSIRTEFVEDDSNEKVKINLKLNYYGDRRFYSRAVDIDEEKFQFKDFYSSVRFSNQACMITEYRTIYIDIEYLESHRETGINMNINSNIDSKTILIPAHIIDIFLIKREEVLREA